MNSHLPRFLIQGAVTDGQRVQLDPREARHARVRRLRRGDAVALFDGAGRSYLGRVASLSRDVVTVVIAESLPERESESPLALTLALAVLKADRFDWVIEKATELGIGRILPFSCQHSLARPSAARCARWQHIALSASKQSGRTLVPRIENPLGWSTVLETPASCRLLFCEEGSGSSLNDLHSRLPHPDGIVIIIGPEGGFTETEVDQARSASCHLVGLGPRILRAETAALTAVALCQHLWGDL